MKRLSIVSAMVLGISLTGCLTASLPSHESVGRQNHSGARMPDSGFKPYVPQVNSFVAEALTLSVLCFAPSSAFTPPIPNGPVGSVEPTDSIRSAATPPIRLRPVGRSGPRDSNGIAEITLREKQALNCNNFLLPELRSK